MPATNYDINVRYHLDDKASKNIAGIGRHARSSAMGVGILSRGLRMLQTAAIGFFGFRAAKKHLIDYNKEMAQARIQMGGLLQLNMGGRWSDNQKRANKLIGNFREDAKASVATTKDFVEFGSQIIGPLTRAGASMKDVRDVTRGGVIAARAFGIEAKMAALDIEQALAGTLTKKDRFARALLQPMGLTTDKWNDMVKKTPSKAAAALVKAFNQPALKKMAQAQETSWAGVVSTFEDSMQRFFGQVGLPLMKTLTKELQGWNKWLGANPKKVSEWAERFGKGLVSGFKTIKNAVLWIVKHRGVLMDIAKAWLAIKIGVGIGGAITGVGGMIGGAGGLLSNLKGANGKLKLFASAVGLGAAAMGLLVVGAQAFANWIDREQNRKLAEVTKGTRDNKFLQDIIGESYGGYKGSMGALSDPKMMTSREQSNARFLASEFRRMGIVGKGGEIKEAKFAKLMGLGTGWKGEAAMGSKKGQALISKVMSIIEAADINTARDKMEHAAVLMLKSAQFDFKARMKANSSLERVLGSYFMSQGQMDFISRGLGWMGLGGLTAGGKKKPVTNVNVTVKKIEVVGDDPDRLAMGLIGAFQELASNPVQTRRMHPGVREGR